MDVLVNVMKKFDVRFMIKALIYSRQVINMFQHAVLLKAHI